MSRTPRVDVMDSPLLLEKQLAESQAETQELYRQLATELKAEHAEELAEMRAEIESKNKLIEQMREALSLILEGAMYNFHYVCQHRDNCLCWSCQKKRVNAALSAVERLEE